MFLSLFPFPEVATIIAFCLASVYVAFGLLGTNGASADISAYQNVNQVQEQICHFTDNQNNQKTYYWDQNNHHPVICEEPFLGFQPYSCKKFVFPIKQEVLPNFCPGISISDRAPPLV